MCRAVLLLVLIANLLACPLRCASCDAGAVSIDEYVPTCCSFCQHEVQSPSSGMPTDCPSDDCSCPNCVCEGATLESGPTIQKSLVQAAEFDVWALSAELNLAVRLMESSVCENADGWFPQCGRDALIAHQIWLI